MKRWITVSAFAVILTASVVISGQGEPSVPYPEGFRGWQHVKSSIVGPENRFFAIRGGIHHFYANHQAVEGYRRGKFPNGSMIVDEGVFTKDGDGPAKGMVLEGDRRSVEVMVKNDRLYKDTGGWGFERFSGNDKTATLSSSDRARCFACHGTQKERDSVFSSIRP